MTKKIELGWSLSREGTLLHADLIYACIACTSKAYIYSLDLFMTFDEINSVRTLCRNELGLRR
jgi:hypothetical protein